MGTNAEWPTFRRIVIDAFQSAGQVMTVAQEASSITGILGLVTAGVGITIFTRHAALLRRERHRGASGRDRSAGHRRDAPCLAARLDQRRHAPLHRDQPEGRQELHDLTTSDDGRDAARHKQKGKDTMENWANRKTLILGRSEMIGLLQAARIRRLRRAGLPHAWRGPLLHGPQGPHRARPLPRRMGGDALLYRGAACRRLQMGVDPRDRTARTSTCRRSSRS